MPKQKILFSQRNVFQLHRLARCFYKETGIRHLLSNENTMLSLIQAAANSNNSHIRHHLLGFVSGLDNPTQSTLAARGIIQR